MNESELAVTGMRSEDWNCNWSESIAMASHCRLKKLDSELKKMRALDSMFFKNQIQAGWNGKLLNVRLRWLFIITMYDEEWALSAGYIWVWYTNQMIINSYFNERLSRYLY